MKREIHEKFSWLLCLGFEYLFPMYSSKSVISQWIIDENIMIAVFKSTIIEIYCNCLNIIGNSCKFYISAIQIIINFI